MRLIRSSRATAVVGWLFQLNLFDSSYLPSSINPLTSSPLDKFSTFSKFRMISFPDIFLKLIKSLIGTGCFPTLATVFPLIILTFEALMPLPGNDNGNPDSGILTYFVS